MTKKTFRSQPIDHKGVRRSRRREAVLEVLASGRWHLSAEEIHKEALKLVPGTGIATVYRALKYLCACGKVLEIVPADGVARYEPAGSRIHHDHLICTSCGSFIEAADPALERLQEKMALRYGFTPSSHRLEIYGVCSACAPRGKKPRGGR